MGIHCSHLDKRERTLIKDWHGQGLSRINCWTTQNLRT